MTGLNHEESEEVKCMCREKCQMNTEQEFERVTPRNFREKAETLDCRAISPRSSFNKVLEGAIVSCSKKREANNTRKETRGD
jgi:hypothetical protein